MSSVPRLLYNNSYVINKDVFTDFQLDKVLSNQAIGVMQKPCCTGEILLRQELFQVLSKRDNYDKIKECLNILIDADKVFVLLKNERIKINRLYLYNEMIGKYIKACKTLASMHKYGKLFANIADYFSSSEKQRVFDEIIVEKKDPHCF